MITARKTYRALSAMLPPWMLAVFAVCLVIPGPFDEIAVILTAVILGLAQPVRFRRAASAWRGGKSHRAWDWSEAGIRFAVTFPPLATVTVEDR